MFMLQTSGSHPCQINRGMCAPIRAPCPFLPANLIARLGNACGAEAWAWGPGSAAPGVLKKGKKIPVRPGRAVLRCLAPDALFL